MSRSLILKRLYFTGKESLLLQNKRNRVQQIIGRHSHGKLYYRTLPPDEQPTHKFTVFIGAVAWWWTFWYLFTETHLLTGHAFPDPSKWTDEELGIPED